MFIDKAKGIQNVYNITQKRFIADEQGICITYDNIT